MRNMAKRMAALLLAGILSISAFPVSAVNQQGRTIIRVGLASASSHNDKGEMACAPLQNNTGFGAGYRFGYYTADMDFVELGRTGADVEEISVLKTQNMYYGYVSSEGKNTYSTDPSVGELAIGCYHIKLPNSYDSYETAAADAQAIGGFVAWIDGSYQVRVGAYLNKDSALAALDGLGYGEIAGTSSKGMVAVKTGTDQILFQYDSERDGPLAVAPDVTGTEDVRTWFGGYKYRGAFTYERQTGGNMTVINAVDLEDYIKGVIPYEIGRESPMEALKAQAICARTYVLRNKDKTHATYKFDVCNSSSCQVYRGVGSSRANYGASALSDQAVDECEGWVLTYQGSLAATYYSSCHGGASEEIANVWTSNKKGDYPYLAGVFDPYEELVADINNYSPWTVTYTTKELSSQLQSYGYGVGTSVDHLTLTYSEMGNVIEVKVHWKNAQVSTIKAKDIRKLFNVKSIRFWINGEKVAQESDDSGFKGFVLNLTELLSDTLGSFVITGAGETQQITSDAYAITGSGATVKLEKPVVEPEETVYAGTVVVDADTYVFDGAGWGHQLGMSQYGAISMAKLEMTADQIMQFYFPGTEVMDYATLLEQ